MGFKFFSFLIPYYGFMITLGIVLAVFFSLFLCKFLKLNFNDLIILSGIIALGAIFGGKILYIIVNYRNINFSLITKLTYLNELMYGGFVFYGAFIGGIISSLIVKYYYKSDIRLYISLIVTFTPFIHAFGRIGCHLVGCCYGICYYSKKFPVKIYTQSRFAPNNIPLFPVQLLEAFYNFLIFLILFFYLLKNKEKSTKSLDMYLILYSVGRFIVEYFRGDFIERGYFFLFSTSQIISILIFIFIIFKLILLGGKKYEI